MYLNPTTFFHHVLPSLAPLSLSFSPLQVLGLGQYTPSIYSTHQHKDVHNSHDEPSLSEGGLASPFYIANSLFSEKKKTM